MIDTPGPVRPTRLEVDLAAIRANVARLRAAAGAELCAVVKADAYGHGAVPVARAALEAGAAWLAVALVEEGEELRAAGIDAPTLLLSEPSGQHAARVLAADLTASVYTPEFGRALDAAAAGSPPRAVHLMVDTGMGRVGAREERWAELAAAAASFSHLTVDGLWTHLARADEPAVTTTDEQLAAFGRAREVVAAAGLSPRWVHAANTAGTLLRPDARLNLVRAGIGIYGLSPAPDVTAAAHGLEQALRLRTAISFAKRVAVGTGVSYGHSWHAPADGWVATLPIGYADGVPRLLSNRMQVLWRGRRVPQVGNVTMDQILIWCGDDEPTLGDEVVLLDGAAIPVDEWAALAGTISYEIACAISARVPRTYRGLTA